VTGRGIEVLRLDDRGVGGSTGSVANSTTADFAEDVLAGVAFLKGPKEINAGRSA
jgi:pimeloyl-ACP methyl ester carboxylesterase